MPPMKRRSFLILGALVLVAVGAGVALALGRSSSPSGDADASHQYLEARHAFGVAATKELSAVQASLGQFAKSAEASCRGTHQSTSEQRTLAVQITRAISTLQRQAHRHTIETFARAVENLRWGDARVSAIVSLFGRQEMSNLATEVGPLCIAGRVSAEASAESPAVVRVNRTLAQRLHAAGYDATHPAQAVRSLVARFATTRDRKLAARLAQLEAMLTGREAAISLAAGAKLEKALGIAVAR
jgi:hypothetical protein